MNIVRGINQKQNENVTIIIGFTSWMSNPKLRQKEQKNINKMMVIQNR